MVQVVKMKFPYNNSYFYPILNIIVFILFIFNILTVFFLGGGSQNQNLFQTLLHYPIRFNKIVLNDVIAGMGEIINILFIPLYLVAYFIIVRNYSWTAILSVLFILLLNLLLISNIIYLLKSALSLFTASKRYKKYMPIMVVLITVLILIALKNISSYLSVKENILYLSNLISIFPSGFYAKYLQRLNSESHLLYYSFILLYYGILNFLLLRLNIFTANKMKRRNFGISTSVNNLKSFSLLKHVSRLNISPFIKKDIIYSLRSPRILLNYIIAIPYMIYLLIYALHVYKELDLFSIILLFEFAFIIGFAGNAFQFEGKGIINYFFRPLIPNNCIRSKQFIANSYTNCFLLFYTILLIIIEINFADILFSLGLLVLNYYFFINVGISLTIYFPKKVNFWSYWGSGISLISIFLAFLFMLIFWWIFKSVFQIYLISGYKIIANIILFSIIGIIKS